MCNGPMNKKECQGDICYDHCHTFIRAVMGENILNFLKGWVYVHVRHMIPYSTSCQTSLHTNLSV